MEFCVYIKFESKVHKQTQNIVTLTKSSLPWAFKMMLNLCWYNSLEMLIPPNSSLNMKGKLLSFSTTYLVNRGALANSSTSTWILSWPTLLYQHSTLFWICVTTVTNIWLWFIYFLCLPYRLITKVIFFCDFLFTQGNRIVHIGG